MRKSVVLLFAFMVIWATGCSSNGNSNGAPSASAPPAEPAESAESTDPPASEDPKKIVLGTSADYAPYEFHAMIDGVDTIVGFDVEIAKEIAKDLGAELEIQDLDFDSLLMSLNTDKVDFVIAGMTPDEERRKNVDFSEIYYYAAQGVLVKKEDAASYTTLADLNSKRIGVQRGSIQEGIAQDEVEGARITSLAKIPELILELSSGRVDALILEKPVAEQYVTTQEGITLADVTIEQAEEESGSAIAVKKGNQELLDAINKTVARLKESGDIERFVVEANELAGETAE
jgi:polar amino acid transport system substrate-binding protein